SSSPTINDINLSAEVPIPKLYYLLVAVAATVVANRVHQANVCVVVECVCVPVYLYLAGERYTPGQKTVITGF
ncbi:hypothetical protein CEXT_506411, partial [Caerostris extrusa]